MTKKEAIARIKDHMLVHKIYEERAVKITEAFDMAISVLEQPERKRGEWQITDAYPHNVYCSECHKIFAQTHWTIWENGSLPRNFCPNCGADMRENNYETGSN